MRRLPDPVFVLFLVLASGAFFAAGFFARGQETGNLVWFLVPTGGAFLFLAYRRCQKVLGGRLGEAEADLARARSQLVQSAKLAALGQLIAGITHDLNSPLGALRSSSTLLQRVLKEHSRSSALVEELDPGQREVFQRLCEALTPEQPFLDFRAEKDLRKRLAALAEAQGHPRPEVLASLVDTGLADRDDLVSALFGLADPGAVLEALEAQATLHRLASVILQATDRASRVVVSLHNFLRTGDDGERCWVSVTASIQDVLPLFQYRQKQGLQLTTSFHGEARVFAWPDKLSQVWVNLITNAAQAVEPEGTIEVSVRVEDQVIVAVTDNGPGIPDSVRERIFAPFFTTKGEGTGLGLDVCRRVVEELDGSISVDSKPGRTVFEVRLPLADPP